MKSSIYHNVTPEKFVRVTRLTFLCAGRKTVTLVKLSYLPGAPHVWSSSVQKPLSKKCYPYRGMTLVQKSFRGVCRDCIELDWPPALPHPSPICSHNQQAVCNYAKTHDRVYGTECLCLFRVLMESFKIYMASLAELPRRTLDVLPLNTRG